MQQSPRYPTPTHVALGDAGMRVTVEALGLRVCDWDEAHAVIAADIADAETARERGLPFLLRAPGETEHAFLDGLGLADRSFVDEAGLRVRIAWMEDHGWHPPPIAPGQTAVALELLDRQGWLEALREAEVDARRAHAEAERHMAAHVAAIEAHGQHLEAQISAMEATLAWRTHLRLRRLKARLRGLRGAPGHG